MHLIMNFKVFDMIFSGAIVRAVCGCHVWLITINLDFFSMLVYDQLYQKVNKVK